MITLVKSLESATELLENEIKEELVKLNLFAMREDALGVASVAYRLKNRAQSTGSALLERGAARIETSARRNNTALYCSEIDLLEHQVRCFVQS